VILWGTQIGSEIEVKLKQNEIVFMHFINISNNEERELVNKIREHRDTIGTDKRIKHKINWTHKELIKQPILEIEGYITYPAQFLENLDEFGMQTLINDILRLQERTPQAKTLKLKIKNKLKKSDKINISLESQARINVTMLRLVNGADIYSIMKGWSEKEKAAALITWRLAQHNKANDLRLMAEMMENKAKDADPYVNRQTDRT
jgi:hypothetical protein